MIRLTFWSIVAVAWLILAAHVAGGPWALPVAAVTVAAVFSVDRLTVWRNRPAR